METKHNLFIKKSIAKDFILNILASTIYTFSTQILAYPFLSRIMSASDYGLLLILMGLANAIGVALSNPLNNTRILLQKKYSDNKVVGDFNLIFTLGLFVNIFLIIITSIIIIGKLDTDIIFIIVISVLIMFRSYYAVSYRLVINYRRFLYSSLFGLLGYLVGISVSFLTGVWGFTFVFGEIFACYYIYKTSKELVFEKVTITHLFNSTFKKYSLIMSAAFLSTVMTYMDRFFIYPFLGPGQVSVYNVASFLGKTGGIILMPIAGVLLTYYAKENGMSLKTFYKRFLSFLGVATLFFLGILIFGKFVTGFLYPTLIDDAIPYFIVANLATTIFILGNTIQPTLLRYCSSKWQPVIQTSYLAIYLILGIFAMKEYGLMGFCFSVLISNIFKIILMLAIVIYTFKKSNGKGLI